jgi:hypothetical protein
LLKSIKISTKNANKNYADVPKVVITGVCAPYIRKVAEFEYRVSGKIGRYGDGGTCVEAEMAASGWL